MAETAIPFQPQLASNGTGPITKELLKWKTNGGEGPTPFGGSSGPEAANALLGRVEGLARCLEWAFRDADSNSNSDFETLRSEYKAQAFGGIGDLICLARILISED